mgnify:CR=1 FL=1|tara:strand:- start:152264 stop:152653 length:390 start_codon:yes stop_codon:yes gene_type:complete
MTLFAVLKTLHVSCALLSVGGFALRGFWMLSDNQRLRKPSARILPHIIDTVLLGSAIGMLLVWQVSPFSVTWLAAKLFALLLYIVLGMVALRFGRTRSQRGVAFVLALVTAAYMFAVALTKDATVVFTW